MAKTILLVCLFFHITSFSRPTLDELGVLFRTDKSSNSGDPSLPGHQYTSVYETFFEPLRDLPITFLEIGFLYGASARMWERYFTKARLYFIDNDVRCSSLFCDFSSRCSLHMIDQVDSQKLCAFAQAVPTLFDVIIDDGGHMMDQQITSFVALFPFVAPGGLYIIEDLHTSYWPEFKDDKKQSLSTIQFLFLLVDHLQALGSQTRCADKNKISENDRARFFACTMGIESIHFYASLCVIQKSA